MSFAGRELISRIYNIFIKSVLFTRFSDAQCGFKAVSRRAVEQIIPQVSDQSWFFDTELLVLGEKQGYRIKDVPVEWVEDDDSRVKIFQTGWEDVKGVFRLRTHSMKFTKCSLAAGACFSGPGSSSGPRNDLYES